MANYSQLKSAVNAVITTNGNNEITGAILNNILNTIIDTIGGNYTFAGVATPSTSVGSPDANVFWIGGAGTYTNFGSSITIAAGNIGIFTYNGSFTRTELVLQASFSTGEVVSQVGIDSTPTANSNNLLTSGGGKSIELKSSYFVCGTVPATAAKVVSASGYTLSVGGAMKIKFTYENGVDSPTLNIGGTGAKPLYYNGAPASRYNSWLRGSTVVVYYDGTNYYANNVIGNVDLTTIYLKNVHRDKYFVEDYGLDANGEVDRVNYPNGKHTAMLPINEDIGYVVYGATISNFREYSAPYFDKTYYLGYKTISSLHKDKVDAGTKYVSIYISTASTITDEFDIISYREINEYLTGTPFEVGVGFAPTSKADYEKQIHMFKYSIKSLYLSGAGVDRSNQYAFRVQKWDGSELRVMVWSYASATYTSVLDKTIDVDSSKLVDTIVTDGQYTLHIIADLNSQVQYTQTGQQNMFLTDAAFSPFGAINALKVDSLQGEVDNMLSTMNRSEYIRVYNDELIVDDKLDEVTESGYINSSTGAPASNSAFVRSAYISLEGAVSVRVKTPYGSAAGLAFYTGNDVSKYSTEFVSGIGYNTGGDGVTWNAIPSTAKYLRTTIKVSDITDQVAVFEIKYRGVGTLQHFVDSVERGMVYEPRVAHIIHGYKAFVNGAKSSGTWGKTTTVLAVARQTFTLSTEDDDAKQIWSASECYVNKMDFCAAVKVNDATSFFGIGTLGSGTAIINELRVHNVGGYAMMEIWSGNTAGDTYETNQPRVVLSKTLSFALTVGNTYKLSMRKFENETYNNVEHMDGVVYTLESFADNVTETIFVPRDTTINNGVRNGITASCKGSQFFSLKLGEVEVDNIFLSSEYDPHAKAMIVGDSLVDGDTMIGEDATTHCGQKYKYACLIQSAIENGDKCFVIAGKGGDAYSGNTNSYLKDEIGSFMPKYVILAFGANHNNLENFQTNLEDIISFLETLGVEPILVTITPVQNGAREAFQTAANTWIKSRPYRYVDINAAVTTDGVHWKDGYALSDGTHPSRLGHQAIYEAFLREIPELFNI